MATLKVWLCELELKKRAAVADAMNATKTDIGWGHQFRFRSNPASRVAGMHAVRDFVRRSDPRL